MHLVLLHRQTQKTVTATGLPVGTIYTRADLPIYTRADSPIQVRA
jgi:hypothetical protein